MIGGGGLPSWQIKGVRGTQCKGVKARLKINNCDNSLAGQDLNKVNLVFPSLLIGKDIVVSIDGEELIQLTVGKTGEISIDKNSQIGREIMGAYSRGATISAIF